MCRKATVKRVYVETDARSVWFKAIRNCLYSCALKWLNKSNPIQSRFIKGESSFSFRPILFVPPPISFHHRRDRQDHAIFQLQPWNSHHQSAAVCCCSSRWSSSYSFSASLVDVQFAVLWKLSGRSVIYKLLKTVRAMSAYCACPPSLNRAGLICHRYSRTGPATFTRSLPYVLQTFRAPAQIVVT